jgi:NADPH:quinone reductase-like Zn-dependent oxidoreductase
LKALGAQQIISRETLIGDNFKPMISTRWAGGLDTVGGKTLEAILRATGLYGNVAVCGLVDTPEFSTTVYPLIIRGVNILGVASAETDRKTRMNVWEKLSNQWKPQTLDLIHQKTIGLSELNDSLDDILAGKTRGRVVLDLWK